MTRQVMRALLLVALSGLVGFASFANTTSFAIPEGTTPVMCTVKGTVTSAVDDGYQMQKLSLKITQTAPDPLVDYGPEFNLNVNEICDVNQVNDVKYLYSSCDERGRCVAVAGGDGPKLSVGEEVEGTLVLMAYLNGEGYTTPRLEVKKTSNWVVGQPPQQPQPRQPPMPPESGKTIDLNAGWNLISVPTDGNSAYAYSQNTCGSTSAWVYKNGKYDRINVNALKPGFGYWVYTTRDCSFSFNKPQPLSVNRQYKTGWNAVDYSFNTLGRNCEVTSGPYAWDSEQQSWIVVSHLENNRGYFVKVKNNCGGGMITEPSMVWASIQPKQCKTNAWDEWYASGEVKYVQEPDEEQLVRDWLSNEYGIEVGSYSQQEIPDGFIGCDACSCPRGDTIKILVNENDLPALEKLDFTEVARNA